MDTHTGQDDWEYAPSDKPKTKAAQIMDYLRTRPGQEVRYAEIAEHLGGEETAQRVSASVIGLMKAKDAENYHLHRIRGGVVYDTSKPGERYEPKSKAKSTKKAKAKPQPAPEPQAPSTSDIVRSLRAVNVELKGGEILVRDSAGTLYRVTPV